MLPQLITLSLFLAFQSEDEAALARGVTLQQRGDTAGAIAEYQQVLKRNPRSAEAHNWLGVAYMQKNQLAAAAAEFRAAIKLKPDLVRAYNNLGSTLAQAGDLEDGIAAFEAGLKQAPNDLPLHLNLGTALRTKGDADGAIHHFELVLKRDPDNPELHHQIGQALRQKGDLDGAVREFELALRLNPEFREGYYILGQTLRQLAAARRPKNPARDPNAEALMARGLELGRARNLRGAIDSLAKAVSLQPEFAEARFNLGAALWYGGEKTKAAAELDQALRLDPAHAQAYNLRGIAYRDSGDLANAQRMVQRAMALNPQLPMGYFDLGLLLLRGRQLSAALGQFEAGLNLPGSPGPPPDLDVAIRELRAAMAGSEDADAHIVLGRLLGLAGADAKQVIAEFDAAIRLKPDHPEARNALGLVYTQINEDEKAVAAFREAIRLRPDYADAHANLGAILTATDAAGSVRELEKAVELRPGFLKARYNLALAYGSSPKHGSDREIAELRKIVAIEADYPRADFSLGKALLRKGNVTEAVVHLERAAKREPEFGEAQYQLGLALSRSGRAGEAATRLKQGREMIAASQRDQTILLDMSEGKAALEKGELDQAVVKFRQVLKERPDLAEAQQQLVRALEAFVREGKFKELQPHIESYVKEWPDSSWGWYVLGYCHFAQQRIGDSINALAKSLSLNVANADAHKVLGRDLMIIGRFEEARREFEQGEKYDPRSAEFPFNLGRLYSIQDQWIAARAAFERALKLDPAYMEAHDGLGFALEALSEDAPAIAQYQKAAQINEERKGTFATPYVNLSAYYNRAGNVETALEYGRKAVAMNPQSDRGWFQLARAHERKGELKLAVEELDRATAINPRASSYYYVLAAIHRKLGNQKESREAMETFSKLDRESNELDRKRRESRERD